MANQIKSSKTGKRFTRQGRRKPVGRSKHFRQPPPSLFRRILRLIFNPISFLLMLFVLLGVFLTLTYYWFEYSERIDILLRGEVFTNTAGIYSAPKTLKKGEKITLEELTQYLESAGYVGKNQQADESRSRFEADENTLKIEPGKTALIDGEIVFPSLLVKFDEKNKTVASITDENEGEEVKQTKLEPRILSAIAAEGDGKRFVVKFDDLPEDLIKAITVTEDRAFFEHYGVNFRGIGRALWRRYEGADDSPLANQGGSSITQQLVKNLLLSSDKTLERKVKEAYMSVILETRLTKKEIFTLYVNQIYLGQQTGRAIYGVGAASEAYFGKDVSALSLAESAFLAGIIRSPNRYNPYKRLEKVTERRNQILDSMLETNNISPKQAKEAKESELKLHKVSSREDLFGLPYFTQYAVEHLPNISNDPEVLQHSRVYTTIDPDLQKAAYEIVNKRLERLEKYFKKKPKGSLQAALVAIKPKTGEIVAMVGGRDYLETQFNRATDAQRQPGSVFKPFVYATAINSAYDANSRIFTTATILRDEKKVFTFGNDTYSPNNYGDSFSNADITLRDSLVKSKNTITVGLGMDLNIGRVMNLAHKAGLPKVEKAYPSMALGTSEATPLQMATAYTVFANLGDKTAPMPISRITDGNGQTITEPKAEKTNVLRPDVAYIMNDMLKDVINRGTAYEAKAWGFKNVEGKRGYAGKTGTSKDGWFAGYTPEIVCVVYVGFDDNSDLGMKGSDSAMPIWAEFMREALRQNPEWNGDWQMPPLIQKAEIDIRTGSLIDEPDAAKIVSTETTEIEQNESEKFPKPHNDLAPVSPNIYVTQVPQEFRRMELFVSGTVPNKALIPIDENLTEDTEPQPNPTATPFTTWQESENATGGKRPQSSPSMDKEIPKADVQRNITLMICEFTKMKATANCPNKLPKTFKEGEEPKQFCSFHIYPRQ